MLGHVFRERALLLRALTHSSFTNEQHSSVGDNETLELLGDAVLSLVTTEALLRATPDAGEGELTVRRAAHVSEAALARAALAAGLPALLRTGKSVAPVVPLSTGADLVEAVLAAVYLDAGLEAARACARLLLGEPPRLPPPRAANPKGTLAERLQRVLHEAPTYRVESDGPSHALTFRARAVLRDRLLGEGEGPNKQAATEAAAAAALAALPEDDGELRARFPPGTT
ncbi:MAG: hypothetical protein A2138_21545 [Deltaproteobacteria bacterium RBG_16_71_12]|nr:MAG: hypothetical protein A2138_21545 [Deltaproteobacteria bacterium RBG_16_71_12]